MQKPVYQPLKNRVDRAEEALLAFSPFRMNAILPDTVIMLLECKENTIVLQALYHLDKFSICVENLQILYEKQILLPILVLAFHEVLFIKRFALKIICQLQLLEAAKNECLLNEKCLELALKAFTETDDEFLIEYSSFILSHLCDEPRNCDYLQTNENFILILLTKIQTTTDPDILHNTCQILFKLMSDRSGLQKYCICNNFPYNKLLGAVSCEYPKIQAISLDIFGLLVLCKEDAIFKFVMSPLFLDEIFKILNNLLLIDLHENILNILRRMMFHNEIAEYFYKDIYLEKLFFYINYNTIYKNQAIGILVEIARIQDSQEILHFRGIIKLLLEGLNSVGIDDMSTGLALMTTYLPAFNEIIEANPIPVLFEILKNENLDWVHRYAAINCLNVICQLSKQACISAAVCKGNEVLSRLLGRSYGEVPLDTLLLIIHLLIRLAKHQEARKVFMNELMAKSLLYALKISLRSTSLMLSLINCASTYISEKILQTVLINGKCSKIILSCLKSVAVALKTAAIDFIILTAKCAEFSAIYIQDGVLSFLLADKKSLLVHPSWSLGIEAILSSNLPIKFAVRGRLDINDVTDDEFYVSKIYINSFQTLQEIIKADCSPLTPIYRTNFNNYQLETKELEDGQRIKSASKISLPMPPCFCYSKNPIDIFLPKYLSQIQEEFETNGLSSVENLSSGSILITDITRRIQILANLVSREMASSVNGDLTEICTEHAIEIHLNELKYQLHCTIIPLGLVKIGGMFERALLFKTIADRVGLPCSLQLGIDHVIAWNEVPIPVTEEDELCEMPRLPTRLLKPTHIVDLMKYPGALYPIGSYHAMKYQNLFFEQS